VSKYQKLFLLVIALVIASAIICYVEPITRGLDIAGGLRVVLQVDPKQKGDWPTSPIEREEKTRTVAETMRRRVAGIGGVTEPIVRTENATSDKARLVVELPGVQNKEKAIHDLITSASLEFYYMKNLYSTANPLGQWRMAPSGDDQRRITFTGPKGEVLTTSDPDDPKSDDRKIIEEVIGPDAKPVLTGAMLKPNAKAAFKPGTTLPVIEIEFNDKGTEIFRDFTGAHIGEVLAVFYDNKLLTAPEIKSKISDGKAIIEGGGLTLKEATRIASYLNAGALPVPLKPIGMDTVEPSLGTQTIARVLVAGIAGLILVLLFMILYYRLPGALASIALGLYALFAIAVYKIIPNYTLSLAGMAALIISIGMAVDANILIFERLKEELKAGKTLRAAIDTGFNRAFTAIFDSNMCTAITCAILMWLGTPTVQSFAFTLLIGVAISMFTAITVTRTFLHLLVNWEWAQNPKLYGLDTGWLSPEKVNWNIVGKRNYFFALSALVLTPGIIVLAMYHLKPGIEFISGTTIQAEFRQKVPLNGVRETVNAIAEGSEVQLVEQGKTAYITTRLLSESPNYKDKMDALRKALDEKYGLATIDKETNQPVFASVSSVGPTISKELTVNAFKAVIVASVLIVLYLAIRFAIGGFMTGLKYGTCAVIALIHDACFILGGYAIMGHWFGWETDSLFVTAVLTIIGFSVHDTIVVFDRIRENLRHRLRGESFEELANRSVLQTLARSINTSLTVILTLLTLIAFGGPLLRHFYITLLAGIIVGTYSSIFNATPLVIVWDALGSRSRAPRRRVEEKAFVDRPLVEKPTVEKNPPAVADGRDGGSEEAASEPSVAKPAVPKASKPKRKKKRF